LKNHAADVAVQVEFERQTWKPGYQLDRKSLKPGAFKLWVGSNEFHVQSPTAIELAPAVAAQGAFESKVLRNQEIT
jgi:hypothetical protein